MADVDMADVDIDDDPVTLSFDIFLKPHMAGTHQVYVLQFPNRDQKQKYSADHEAAPLKMRVKPGAGMVELDVPMDVRQNYDRQKGVKWGGAMKKSKANHGLPGGFGIGGSAGAGRGANRRNVLEDHDLQQQILNDYERAIKDEQVLVKQTLGGQSIPNDENTPQYMIGTFMKNQLHLTPVDNIVQMRPQFHHIDAQSEQDRVGRVGATTARVAEARAVHMTVKSNIDGEEETTDTMAQRITAAQTEQWIDHKFVDEDSDEAWRAYGEMLFVTKDKEEGWVRDLTSKVPNLTSIIDDAEYLDALSAPRDAAKLSRSKKIPKSKKGKEKETATETVDSDSSTLSDSSGDEEVVAAAPA